MQRIKHLVIDYVETLIAFIFWARIPIAYGLISIIFLLLIAGSAS